MPRQTPSASDYTSVVRSSAVANDVASKPAGSPAAVRAAGAAVRGGGGLASLGAIGSIVRQSVVAKSIAPIPVRATVTVAPVPPLQAIGTTVDVFVVSYDSAGVGLWSAKITSTNTDIGFGITTDLNGNVYVTGRVGTNGLTVTAYSANGLPFATTITTTRNDGFLIKYNSSGVVQWFVKLGNTNLTPSYVVATDQSGNVFVAGRYLGGYTPTNSNGSSFGKTLSHLGSNSYGFIVKYNASGFVQWCARLVIDSLTGGVQCNGIVIDSNGDAYITGFFGSFTETSILTLYDLNDNAFATTIANRGTSGNDAFVIKYSSAGSVLWGAKVASTGGDIGQSITVDPSNNVYVIGQGVAWSAYSSNGNQFGTDAANSGGSDVFIVKYNSSGIVQWATRIASANGDNGFGIAADSNSNIYVTGQTEPGNAVFYNSDSSSFSTAMTGLGGSEAFVAKYNTSGIAQWIAKIAGTGNDIGNGIITDSNSNVYVVGQSASTTVAAFNSGGTSFSKTLTNAGLDDAFIVKYNSNGIVQWIASVAGSGTDIACAVAVDNLSGKIYVTGQFTSNPLTISNA